jgi:hypothetical protein
MQCCPDAAGRQRLHGRCTRRLTHHGDHSAAYLAKASCKVSSTIYYAHKQARHAHAVVRAVIAGRPIRCQLSKPPSADSAASLKLDAAQPYSKHHPHNSTALIEGFRYKQRVTRYHYSLQINLSRFAL